jgi:alpha-galactosidase
LNPFTGNEAAWSFVSEDQSEAYVGYYKILSQPNPPLTSLKLKGLNPDINYRDLKTGNVYGGDELMYSGILIPAEKGDFTSTLWTFKCLDD